MEECEAFLNGRLGEVFPAPGALKPAWVWLNQLAHGDLAQVEKLLRAARPGRLERLGWRGRRRGAPAPQSWPEAIAVVARELLWSAGSKPSELRRLQAGLVRLELELSKDRAGVWLTPERLMRKGLDALWTDLADEERGRVDD